MIKTTAVYFDGYSSSPINIEMEFDESDGTFMFDFAPLQLMLLSIPGVKIENIGNTMKIRPAHSSFQYIKVENPECIETIKKYLAENVKVSPVQKFLNLGFYAHITITFILIGFMVLSYMLVIPALAESAVKIIPEEFDDKLGNTLYNEYCNESEFDSAKTEQLYQFAEELDLKNKKPIYITVLNSSQVNAFALPDGNVIIYTGILDKMKSYEELAALISHEVAHVNKRHSMKMICRRLSGELVMSSVLGGSNAVTSLIGKNINSINVLSYSREFEREADFGGFELMIANKIDPKGMTNLFRRLQSEGPILVPGFLSTHPLTEDRLTEIEKYIYYRPHEVEQHPKLEELFKQIIDD